MIQKRLTIDPNGKVYQFCNYVRTYYTGKGLPERISLCSLFHSTVWGALFVVISSPAMLFGRGVEFITDRYLSKFISDNTLIEQFRNDEDVGVVPLRLLWTVLGFFYVAICGVVVGSVVTVMYCIHGLYVHFFDIIYGTINGVLHLFSGIFYGFWGIGWLEHWMLNRIILNQELWMLVAKIAGCSVGVLGTALGIIYAGYKVNGLLPKTSPKSSRPKTVGKEKDKFADRVHWICKRCGNEVYSKHSICRECGKNSPYDTGIGYTMLGYLLYPLYYLLGKILSSEITVGSVAVKVLSPLGAAKELIVGLKHGFCPIIEFKSVETIKEEVHKSNTEEEIKQKLAEFGVYIEQCVVDRKWYISRKYASPSVVDRKILYFRDGWDGWNGWVVSCPTYYFSYKEAEEVALKSIVTIEMGRQEPSIRRQEPSITWVNKQAKHD